MRYDPRDEGDGQDDGERIGEGADPFVTYKPNSTLGLRSPLPPWHLWGNSQVLEGRATNLVSSTSLGQVIKVSYRRPETWRWLFSTKLIAATPVGVIPGDTIILEVFFDLSVGIGRSVILIPSFDSHRIQWTLPAADPIGTQLWTTTSRGNRLQSTTGAGVVTLDQTLIDQVTAQDIQLQTRLVTSVTGGAVEGLRVEVGAHFSPNTHVRPDWYGDSPPELAFAGAETGGT